MPNDQLKFATYIRDSAMLDYANNRYYVNNEGRFMTPDRYMSNAGGAGDPNNPHSWNRYAYVGGDPVNKNDPMGLCSPEDDPPCYSVTGTGSGDDIGWDDASHGSDAPLPDAKVLVLTLVGSIGALACRLTATFTGVRS